jgi:hypothetical protein
MAALTQTVKSQNISFTSKVNEIFLERMVKCKCICFVRMLYLESYSDYIQQCNVVTQL